MDGDVLRGAGAVVLVFALLGAALWAFRHIGWYRGGITGPSLLSKNVRSLEAVERLVLTPQHSLYVVRVHSRQLLVAAHPHGCALIADLGRADSTAAGLALDSFGAKHIGSKHSGEAMV
jgi:flagellar biogenesis protein FliO